MQQFKTSFNACCSLVLVCKDIIPKYGKTKTLFFGINDKILKSKSSVQQKKFYKLLQESKTENDPEKVILTFPSMYFPILKRSSLRKV